MYKNTFAFIAFMNAFLGTSSCCSVSLTWPSIFMFLYFIFLAEIVQQNRVLCVCVCVCVESI